MTAGEFGIGIYLSCCGWRQESAPGAGEQVSGKAISLLVMWEKKGIDEQSHTDKTQPTIHRSGRVHFVGVLASENNLQLKPLRRAEEFQRNIIIIDVTKCHPGGR